MTMDHLGAYGFELPGIRNHTDMLRLVGRISAPVFLYLFVESLRYTHDKIKLLRRVYVAALCTGITNIFVSVCLGYRIAFGNIFQSYFWVAYMVCFLEYVILRIKEGEKCPAIRITFSGILLIVGLITLDRMLVQYNVLVYILDTDNEWIYFIRNIICTVCFSPVTVEYSLLFIGLGVVWYFQTSKIQRCIVLIILCALSFFGIGNNEICLIFISGNQWAMIGAIVLIILYNGQYGSGLKYFFYVYYPAHCYLIACLQCFYLKWACFE